MNILQISPDILQWAAEQSRLSIDALIDLLKCPKSKHEELISGKFTVNQLKDLADKTHIPCKLFKVSTWVIARRAYEFSKITFPQYRAIVKESSDKKIMEKKEEEEIFIKVYLPKTVNVLRKQL